MKETSILALDVGEKRVGIAIANTSVRLPRPLTTLINDETFWDKLQDLIRANDISEIVVGLPRNLNGDDTSQTGYTRDFSEQLRERTSLPVNLQDEAGTSVQAEQELNAKKKSYNRSDIDALAATYILEDFLKSQGTKHV